MPFQVKFNEGNIYIYIQGVYYKESLMSLQISSYQLLVVYCHGNRDGIFISPPTDKIYI